MNFLQKSYESIKSSPKLLFLCDLYVQISLFLVVGTLGLGLLSLVFDGNIVGLLLAVCITSIFVLQFYSFYKKRKTLFAACSLFVLVIYALGAIGVVVWVIADSALLYYFIPIALCLTSAACNSFFWHYRRNDSMPNDRFRIFVMLELGFLHFLLISYFFCFFAEATMVFLGIFEFCTLLYIVAHKIFPPVKKLTELYSKAGSSQQDTTVNETYDILTSSEREESFQQADFMFHYFKGFFILYTLTAFASWMETAQNINNRLADEPMLSMNGFLPISIAMLLFCIVWGALLLANTKGLGVKICTAYAVIASIPCIVYFLFKLLLV